MQNSQSQIMKTGHLHFVTRKNIQFYNELYENSVLNLLVQMTRAEEC
jgi:hypothetical protein